MNKNKILLADTFYKNNVFYNFDKILLNQTFKTMKKRGIIYLGSSSSVISRVLMICKEIGGVKVVNRKKWKEKSVAVLKKAV